MATVYEITDPLRSIYRTVLPAGPGVCEVCHAQPGAGFRVCYSCTTAMGQVSHPIRRIVPISLTARGEQLYYSLVHYKRSAPPWDQRAQQQQTFRVQLAALFGRFVAQHGACVTGDFGRWDAIVVVPSTRTAPGGIHPLHQTLSMLPGGARMLRTPLRVSDEHFAEREASDGRFVVTDEVRGQRILVVDDTMTTGARLQSAASALALHGAEVVAGVPIARLINVDYSPDVWQRACKDPYDFDVCCVEGDAIHF